MKLYVIPVEALCNAKCKYCITKQRNYNNNFLKIDRLKEVLENNIYNKIEITGGGEPSLHPEINKIIKMCNSFAETQIYTNGTLDPKAIHKSVLICLSRAHFDDVKNKNIMGIDYNIKKFLNHKLKLSLLLHNSGISTENEIYKYIDWAKKYAKKIVIRQFFEPLKNKEYYKKEFVSTQNILTKNKEIYSLSNKKYLISNVEVEVEERTCACEMENPVLHADGTLSKGWN